MQEADMFRVDEYFEGKVKSLAFKSLEGPATVGVIAPAGTYKQQSSRQYTATRFGAPYSTLTQVSTVYKQCTKTGRMLPLNERILHNVGHQKHH